MPLYPKAIVKNIPPPSNDPPITARVVILHVADSEGDSLYPYFNGHSGGIESHFYVRYTGVVEQYRDTNYQADANMQANMFAISIETEGLANGTWTPAQLEAIKALLLWLHDSEGIKLVVPKTWDGYGVGYHVLFEAEWDGRNASCPGPNRIKQFNDVLVPWMAAGGKDDDLLLTDKITVATPGGGNEEISLDTLFKRMSWAYYETVGLKATESAQSVAIKALADAKGADSAAITQAVIDKINAMQLTITAEGS